MVLKKIAQIFILCSYWLCLVPSLVYFLRNEGIIDPSSAMEYFSQYSILLFVLIIIYWIIHHIFDNCYTKYEVRRKVREIMLKRRMILLEQGKLSTAKTHDLMSLNSRSLKRSKKRKVSVKRSSSLSSKSSSRNASLNRFKVSESIKGVRRTDSVRKVRGHKRNMSIVPKAPPPPYIEFITNERQVQQSGKV